SIVLGSVLDESVAHPFRSREYEFFANVESRAPQQVCNHRFFEPRSIEFHAHDLLFFVKANAANSIDLANAVNRTQGRFGGTIDVSVGDFQLSHFCFDTLPQLRYTIAAPHPAKPICNLLIESQK